MNRAGLLAGIAIIAPSLAGAQTPASLSVPATPASTEPAADPQASPGPSTDPIAQAAAEADSTLAQDVVVTGARATQRTSIELKRNASVIVDGIVSDEIGASPDNNVGDTLERITGVTGDRFKGNTSEISIRGLGPTLSFSTLNGREVSTAGSDRSVSFQQFPSELVNGVLVYKSQQADFLEGGVGGIIELRTIKPLDYGRRRIQMEFRGDFQPKDDDIIRHDGLGYRANFSYTDQYSTGIGEIGVSIGAQRQHTAAPEESFSTNSTYRACTTSSVNPLNLTGAGSALTCADATTARAGETVGQRYFANPSYTFRSFNTTEKRDAVMGAIQWRPSPDFEIAVDGQYSNRNSYEDRNALAITEGLRAIRPLLIGDGTNGYSQYSLMSWQGNSNVESQQETRRRNEEYIGGGLTLTWKSGPFTLVGDGSYSGSHRTERNKLTRLRSTRRVGYTATFEGDDVVPTILFDNFDVTDPNSFLNTASNSVYAHNRFGTNRRDNIWAGRLDGSYEIDGGLIEAIKVGGRYSDHHRTNDFSRNTDISDISTLGNVNGLTAAQRITLANQNCRMVFPSSSFLSGTGTNITRWATFDDDCLYRTFTGSDGLAYPTDGRDPSDINVRERIKTAYIMATFRSDDGAVPFSGNLGVRYIDTRINSIGYRLPIVITVDPGANTYDIRGDTGQPIVETEARGHYGYWLPSANIAFNLSPITKLRLAAYRAIARSGIEDFGAGIDISAVAGAGGVQDIVFNATTGNPDLKPLRAWNLDASLELYFSKDSVLAIAGYYKLVRGTVIRAQQAIPTDIQATVNTVGSGSAQRTFTIYPLALTNDTELRRLYGVEVTASHAFTWLPSPLDGFGVQGSANRSFANFEYPDPSPVAQYLEPENLLGLSKWVASGSVYWEKYGVSLRANYRYRSSFYNGGGTGTSRTVRGAGYLNLSAQYDINKSVQLKAQVLNVTGVNNTIYRGVYDTINEVSSSGSQYFLGVRFRL